MHTSGVVHHTTVIRHILIATCSLRVVVGIIHAQCNACTVSTMLVMYVLLI